jgi:hypothetical protein
MHAVCVALLRCVTVNVHQQLSQGPRIVQEQALTAIASAAEAAGTAFATHYAATMPLLKQVRLLPCSLYHIVITVCNS